MSDKTSFRDLVSEGIPGELPPKRPLDAGVSHAPARKQVLSAAEKALALKNALAYDRDLHFDAPDEKLAHRSMN